MTGDPPKHCPFCGRPIELVRHIFGNMYEIDCAECERSAVILIDDHEKIASGTFR